MQLHCYEVTLIKKCNKPLLQKSETKVFDQKRFIKNLLKVSEKNNSGVLRINQIMSKLLIAENFHILHCTNHLRHFITTDHK